MVTRVLQQLNSGAKIIQVQAIDVADTAVSSTPGVVAIQSAPTIYNNPLTTKNGTHRV